MNRNGESALVGEEVVGGIWALSGQTPGRRPRDLATRILEASDLDLSLNQAPNGTAIAAALVANLLNMSRDRHSLTVPI